MIGFIVGLRAEARLLRPLGSNVPVAASGATRAGAGRAIDLLLRAGATELVSLGLAAGLDPAIRPGQLVVPCRIVIDGSEVLCSPALCARLGGDTGEALLHSDVVVAAAAAKRALHASTGCAALDMESGVMALAAQRAGLPFAALRAICDPAERDVPAAAQCALAPDGRLAVGRMLASLLHNPGQMPHMVALARDAVTARRRLSARIRLLHV